MKRLDPHSMLPAGRLTGLLRGALPVLVALLAAPLASAQDYDKFVADFRAAMGIHDSSKMASLVKSKSIEAAWHVDRICTGIAETPSEELELEAQALITAWKQGRGTGFAENYYSFLSLMRSEDKRERSKFKRSFDRALAKFNENVNGSKDGPTYETVANEMEGLASAFAAIGDQYYTANCWATYAACYNEGFRSGDDVDLVKVTTAFERALAAFERVDLKHIIQGDIAQNYKRLTAEGWKEAAGNPDAPEPGEPKPVDKSLAVTVPMTFEALKKADQFIRPNYSADDMYQCWQWLSFAGVGTEALPFPALKDGPRLKRSGSAALEVDFDQDGKADTEVKLTGNKTVVECDLVAGDAPRKWAFMLVTGIEQDNYQGLQYHMAPSDIFVNTYYIGAGSMVGTLGETQVRVIDENCDGIYGGTPLSWEYLGLTQGNYQWDLDSMVIGNSKRAVPVSKYTQVGDQWYQMETQQSGTSFRATPVELETGKLKLSFKGPSVRFLIVRGEGRLEGSYFDVMDSKSGIEVPVGTYTLMTGEVMKGKKQQAMKTLIMPGTGTPKWTVKAGKTTSIELGSPFSFDFQTQAAEEGAMVLGKTVVITGKSGERYERPWNCAPRPEVSVRKAGAKKGGKAEKMDVVMDMLASDGAGGYRFGQADAWFPLDTVFPFKGEGGFEVQLVEKKNPLFGKITSEWK